MGKRAKKKKGKQIIQGEKVKGKEKQGKGSQVKLNKK